MFVELDDFVMDVPHAPLHLGSVLALIFKEKLLGITEIDKVIKEQLVSSDQSFCFRLEL